MTFEEYARAKLPLLMGMARIICRDDATAEDVLHDVLIKVNTHWVTVCAAAEPDAYVRRMIVNESISLWRKWNRLSSRAGRGAEARSPDHAEGIADRHELQQLIRRLPDRQRTVIGLRYYAQLSDREIAASLGCTEGTVRSHASRALRTLRIDLCSSIDLGTVTL